MTKGRFVIGALLVTILVSGCAELFEFSLYGGLDPTPVPSAEDLKAQPTSEALATLKEDFESPTLFDELEKEPEKKAELSAYLEEVWEDLDAEPSEKQEAQLLYADLHLRTTGGDEFVNNVTAVADDLATMASGEMFSGDAADIQEDVQGLFEALIPEDIAGEPEAIAELLDGLITANAAYEAFETSLEGAEPPAGTNMGEVAQSALVSFLVGTVADVVAPEGGLEEGESQGQALYELIFSADTTELSASLSGVSEISLDGAPQNTLEAAGFELDFGGEEAL